MWIVQQISFQPLTSLVSLLKCLWKFVYVTERSRQKHDKNVWEWSHVLGEGMDFQAKEWSFLFRNRLIEHIGCKAGAVALSFIQCSHSHKILIFLSYYIHCYVFQLVCHTSKSQTNVRHSLIWLISTDGSYFQIFGYYQHHRDTLFELKAISS